MSFENISRVLGWRTADSSPLASLPPPRPRRPPPPSPQPRTGEIVEPPNLAGRRADRHRAVGADRNGARTSLAAREIRERLSERERPAGSERFANGVKMNRAHKKVCVDAEF